MDLFSDFKAEHWQNKGSPPEKIANLDGYETQNILRTSKEDTDQGPAFTYYTSSDGGIPCHAVLYGAKRDPLKSIGHCGMKVVSKNNVSLITGCVVEEDWVEMKQEYFDSLDVHGPPPKDDEPKRLSLIIGLISDLHHDKWTKKEEDPPKNKTSLGYGYYTVVRETPENDLRSYFLNDCEGRPLQGYLEHAERDPLRSIGNCYLKLVKANGKEMIKGIIVDHDWVEAN